jgi:hypothetical protein
MVGAALTGLWTWELVAPFAQGTTKEDLGVLIAWVIFVACWPVTIPVSLVVRRLRRNR